MFNAASKLYFTVAGFAIVLGFGYVVVSSDRVGFTNLVVAGLGALALGLAAFAFVPGEALTVASDEPASSRPADATDTAAASNWPVLAALALGLVAAGAAAESSLIALGVVVGVLAAFAWFSQVWREHPSWTPAMTDRLNDRFVVPFALPAMIFVLAGIGVISLSRLFLAVPVEAAPVIGILLAFAILGAFFLLSTRRVGRPALATLTTVAVALVLAAGVAGALKGEREFHEAGADAGHGGEGSGAAVIEAENLAFDTEQLDLPANTAVELLFVNHEAIPHNVSIYESEGGDAIFEGEILETEGEVTYEIDTPEPGSYYFQCDVHPAQMNGTVNVSLDASEESDAGAGSGSPDEQP